MRNQRDGGGYLKEIEKAQNHKMNQLAFVIWSLAMVGLGMLISKC
jgi:hypothetical protein